MPTYDYFCEDCGHELEAFHSMNAEPLRDCPACGKPALKKKIGAGAGLLFKGSGFYQTDYRSESYQKSAKAEKGESKPKADASKKGSDSSKTTSSASSTP